MPVRAAGKEAGMGKEFRDGFQNYVRKEVPANNRKGRRVVYEYQGEMRHFVMTAVVSVYPLQISFYDFRGNTMLFLRAP